MDGTIELPRTMPGQSSGVYTVGRLGGAHRRSDRKGERPTGRASVPGAGSGRDDEWTSIWPDDTPTVQRPSPLRPPMDDRRGYGPEDRRGYEPDDRRGYEADERRGYDHGASGYDHRAPSGYDRGPSGYDNGPAGYDRGPSGYDRGPSGYDRGLSATDTGTWDTIRPDGYPVSGTRSGSGARPMPMPRPTSVPHPTSGPRPTSGVRPTSGSRAESVAAESGRRGRGGSRRRPSRPMRYTGARRKFSSWAPLGGGVLMLALVLGATMLAESDRYTGTSSAPPASAPAAAAQEPPSENADVAAANSVAAAINKELDDLGCGRVKVDQTLVTAAGTQVEDMLDRGYFSTTGPDGGTSIQRAQKAGYKGTKVAESVVSGAGNPAEAAQAAFPVDPKKQPAGSVKVVSGGPLTCGWTAVGAEARMNDKSVAYWSIVLGQ
ncbi:hypothetical protein [Cryptosporangium phraense]|uniref:SCP domain-containing protein n=1 Tax=Cryptosporangium phraense TaxID=2593070 RepID=A0A545AVS4_9ACTN|nr:hypothetical protein [Cryptosporangium phraense]TQS45420.1 hypothetical protein FL583_10080 [Cryptosporangium phraense]